MSVAAQGLSVVLGGRAVLHDVTFAARPGEVTAIVGPNGSGKTTLLRALTGEIGHTGRVTIDGRATGEMRPWELATMRAVLPQATTLAFPFTVAEVVRLGLQAGPHARRSDLVGAALARLDLAGFAGRFYQELSGGEQQRVQLARTLVQVWEPVADGTPRWLFLDEPVSSLDIAHQLQCMDVAADFAARGGGVIAVMHDLNLTAMSAHRVALMTDGRLAALGPVADVFTDANLSRAYGCDLRLNAVPPPGVPFVLPHLARAPKVAAAS